MSEEICTIKITVRDKSDHYREEDWVKDIWGYMVPFFTRRHGVNKAKIDLEDGAVIVEWEYVTNYDANEYCEPPCGNEQA